ncbi:MAG TPA: pilus assembly protein TadG-related protein [Candidatus Dormibacteraeota bacterium]|nr:pilus assembly protein TadG-related protein [Candidatus Dormibacteraeota bacterium]
MGGQRGQAIVLIALMLTIVIGMAAIAIDGSRAYALRRDMQAATDAASLAAGDRLQQSGSWTSAEQAGASTFATNLRLYAAPACSGWGAPSATPFTVTCTYADGTVLTEVAQGLGAQGSQFTVSGQRNLQLQFARILSNGTSPAIVASSTGNVNNQRYTPALGALDSAGCGSGGSAITVAGSGTLSATGDIVSNGAISVSSGAVRVAGDIYARCQSPVPGAVTTACYPSGGGTPCGYPDVAGAMRSGFHLADPQFPEPTNLGSSQGIPSSLVAQPGIYSWPVITGGGHCWFLAGGIYTFQAGLANSGDLISNELKPPGEPSTSDNTQEAANQFWNTGGANCAGGFQLTRSTGARDVADGVWSIVITAVRTDTYNGTSYPRESAPSMCQQVNLNPHFNAIQVDISNVPGATSYNVYAAPPGNGCGGPFGLAASVPVSGSVLNTNLASCPSFTGNSCSLGHETISLNDQLAAPFAPNAGASPGTAGAYPPDSETAPLSAGLPNQNPATGAGARGDRANENNCETAAAAYTSCPAAITPGAVELYFPSGGCFSNLNGGDVYVFSGYQYNWVSLYEPGPANPPANGCTNTFGAGGNSGYVGLIYTPSAHASITSPLAFEVAGTGGLIADTIAFTNGLPRLTYSSTYAPVAPASRITG